MKVNGRDEAAPARPPDKEGFRRALTAAPGAKAQRPAPAPQSPGTPRPGSTPSPAPRTGGPTVAPQPRATAGTVHLTSRGAFASTEHLGHVRQNLHSEAHRLKDVRGESLQVNRERVEQRVAELVTRELAREPHLEAAPRAPTPRPPPEPAPALPSGEALCPVGEPRGGAQAGGATSTAGARESDTRAQVALALIEKIDVFMKSQRPALSLRLGGALEATVEVERTGSREVALRIQGHRGPVAPGQLEHIREALASRGLRLSRLLAS